LAITNNASERLFGVLLGDIFAAVSIHKNTKKAPFCQRKSQVFLIFFDKKSGLLNGLLNHYSFQHQNQIWPRNNIGIGSYFGNNESTLF
jgi:hypothetical protein